MQWPETAMTFLIFSQQISPVKRGESKTVQFESRIYNYDV